jgi:hypothetical protein
MNAVRKTILFLGAAAVLLGILLTAAVENDEIQAPPTINLAAGPAAISPSAPGTLQPRVLLRGTVNLHQRHRVVVSNEAGTYSMTNLPPSSYEVTFEKSGFNTLKYSQVVVTLAEALLLNAEFTIRGAAETVEVKGQIESLVEVESSHVSNIVDTTLRRIRNS